MIGDHINTYKWDATEFRGALTGVMAATEAVCRGVESGEFSRDQAATFIEAFINTLAFPSEEQISRARDSARASSVIDHVRAGR